MARPRSDRVILRELTAQALRRCGATLYRWLRDNSLSITFFALFVAAAVAQSLTGVRSYNGELRAHHMAAISYLSYLGTGTFWDGMFVNWQAAILQLGCLIVFSELLRQKGAAHSRKPEGEPETDPKRDARRNKPKEDRDPWIYRNSLSLAFFAIFIGSFVAHMIFGAMAYNERQALSHLPSISLTSYLGSSTFWFLTTQTWEAEAIAIALFMILTIFLRQQGSAESKPVESSDRETGDTNE